MLIFESNDPDPRHVSPYRADCNNPHMCRIGVCEKESRLRRCRSFYPCSHLAIKLRYAYTRRTPIQTPNHPPTHTRSCTPPARARMALGTTMNGARREKTDKFFLPRTGEPSSPLQSACSLRPKQKGHPWRTLKAGQRCIYDQREQEHRLAYSTVQCATTNRHTG